MADLKSSATRNLAHYREIHRTDPRYGRSSQKLVGLIADAVRAGQATTPGWQPKTLLDFGCGKSQAAERVAKKLGLTHFLYDPAIPGLETLPVAQADLVMNTDVLEHLDETEVDLLISDVRGLTDHAYFNIATAPASKVLDSGENAHATVQPPEWWQARIAMHFPTVVRLPAAKNRVSFATWQISEKELRRVVAGDMWRRKDRIKAVMYRLGLG